MKIPRNKLCNPISKTSTERCFTFLGDEDISLKIFPINSNITMLYLLKEESISFECCALSTSVHYLAVISTEGRYLLVLPDLLRFLAVLEMTNVLCNEFIAQMLWLFRFVSPSRLHRICHRIYGLQDSQTGIADIAWLIFPNLMQKKPSCYHRLVIS